MEQKINLLDLTLEETEGLMLSMGEQKFRSKQVYQWVNRGIEEIDDMTNLSKNLRQALKEKVYLGKLKIKHKLVSKLDSTAKYLLELNDGNVVESVLMHYKHGLSVCISSQVGCRMGCSFCASTGLGLIRNLSAGEILDQIITIQKDSGERVGNIVIMGIGEPLDNYDNIAKFLRLVNHSDGLNIGFRHISLSTCGLVPKIIELSGENMPITLSISLHAPNDKIRGEIMPINRKYSIDKIIEACKIYTGVTNRRVTFEYAMIAGLNDSRENAIELARRIKGMLCHVNLIPINPIDEADYKKSDRQKIENFRSILEGHGVETTVRRELGTDINAACGQLRRSAARN